MSKDLTSDVKRFDAHYKDRSTYGSTEEKLRVSDADAPETHAAPADETPEGPPAPPLSPEELHAIWNAGPVQMGCAPSKRLTVTIRRNLERLIREHPDIEWWDDIFTRVMASPYL